MDAKLVLTGVTGSKSGGVLVEHIAENIAKIKAMFQGGIRIICRKTSNTEKVESRLQDVEIRRGSFLDKDFLTESLKDADTVIHIAGIYWSRKVVDAAVKNHVHRLILVHTTGIYSRYKAAGEEYRQIDSYVEEQCRQAGIILTILRPTMIYGNVTDQNVVQFIKMVDKFPLMPVVRGAKYELQPVHYKDLGKAYFDVLINEAVTADKNYVLSGGEVIQLRDMLTVIGEKLGKKVRFVSFPFWFAYSVACCLYYASFGKIDYREKVQRLCEPRVYSHQEAGNDFGYNPRDFQTGIVDEVKEYKGSTI